MIINYDHIFIILLIYYGNMAEKNQQGEIQSLKVHDEAKRASIEFLPLAGDGPLGSTIVLKLTNNNETAFNAMVSAAEVGIVRQAEVGFNTAVRYDTGNMELDEITVR
jgi:hypothetical protein